MAKGNLFLGTARRSVGDVVMYRREGSQVARVRVRKISNPRTDAQSAQRSFFSPVAKFYSPLAVVLERSYEGKNKSQSYSAFLRDNVKLARKNGWLLPKGTGFFPLPYQLSVGTLPAVPVSSVEGDKINIPFKYSDGMNTDTLGNVSKIFIQLGYKDGDIVTLISTSYDSDTQAYFPTSGQFEINSTSEVPFNDVLPDYSVITASLSSGQLRFEPHDGISGGAAVIVSRNVDGKWTRSSASLMCTTSHMNRISSDEFKSAAIASYGNAPTGDNPLVYLDGDELQR